MENAVEGLETSLDAENVERRTGDNDSKNFTQMSPRDTCNTVLFITSLFSPNCFIIGLCFTDLIQEIVTVQEALFL